jgi:hypothetical protein
VASLSPVILVTSGNKEAVVGGIFGHYYSPSLGGPSVGFARRPGTRKALVPEKALVAAKFWSFSKAS